jgi:hypothetical protein
VHAPDSPLPTSLPQAQLALGASSALPTLVDVLRRSAGDLAMVRPVLECLAVALAPLAIAAGLRISVDT